MLVAKITFEKSEQLRGQEYQSGGFFSPVQDYNENWIISLVEAQFLQLGDFEIIEYEPKESDNLISENAYVQ